MPAPMDDKGAVGALRRRPRGKEPQPMEGLGLRDVGRVENGRRLGGNPLASETREDGARRLRAVFSLVAAARPR